MTDTNQAQQSQDTGPTPAEQANGVMSYDERAARAFAGDDEPSSNTDPAMTSQVRSDVAAGAPVDEVAQRRAERRKELQKLIAEDAAKLDDRAKRTKLESEAKEADRLRKEREELTAKLSTAIDPASLSDAQKFFELAEKAKVDPKKLGEWLTKQQQHPERIAAEVAKRELDPELSAMRKENADLKERLDALDQSLKTKDQRAEAMQNAERILTFTKSNAAQAPLTAAFLETYGVEQFVALANGASEGIPMHAGWEQHLLDAIEDQLAELGKIYKPQSGNTERKAAPPPQNNGAAKPMTTISNQLAQQRASVVDEDVDFAKLPYEERARRAFGSW